MLAPIDSDDKHRWRWRAFLILLTVLAVAMHVYRIAQSYDLFIDEPFYTQVGQSVAHGHLPYATGNVFFLHPPGFFLMEAVWMHLFGIHTGVFAQVYSVRILVAILAALTVPLITIIVAKVADRTAAVAAGVIYIVNAFVNRDSSFVILETATMFWALTGYAVLTHLGPLGGRRRAVQVPLAGVLFGLSILSKEFAVFITLVPLAIEYFVGSILARREVIVAGVLAAVPYCVWVLIVVQTGNWSSFSNQFSSGFRRTDGTEQTSGFNRPGAPSFLQTAIKDLSYLWTAYVILLLGSAAIIYLAWKAPTGRQRFIALFGLGAMPLIIYCVFIGTNEEQFFNFLLAPALICLVTVLRTTRFRLSQSLRALVIAAGLIIVAYDSANYVIVHTQPDNGTLKVDQWMKAHVTNGTVVAVTNPVQREIFLRYTMVDDENGGTLNQDVRYLVVFYRQVDENYAFVDRKTIDVQTKGLTAVFSTHDRSNGQMTVYAVP